MTLAKRLKFAAMVLAAAAASALPRLAPAQNSSKSGQNTPSPNNSQVVAEQDLERLTAILNDPSQRQEQREEAARRLVSRQQTSQTHKILGEALKAINPGVQLAAARALADDPDPDESLIGPLFDALGGNRQLTEAAAHALANYKSNPDVLTRLINIVQRRPAAPELVRREIIRALGSIVEKRAAELLITVLQSPDETLLIHNTAADALADMTGHNEFGQDSQAWSDWWTRAAALSDENFRNALLPRRSARYDQVRQRYTDLSNELQNILNSQYQTAPAQQRPDVLMRYLKNPEPQVRAVGALIIRDDALDNKTIPQPAKDQLRTMIGDSSSQVRIAAADALSKINDASALDPLLTQLAQETDPQVRAEIAQALAPINDLRAVPPLLGQLDDPSYAAARAAASALADLGPKIRDDAKLAQQSAAVLQQELEKRASSSAGNAELRETLVDAMIPLRQENLLPTLYRLLDERRNESAEIHRLSLKAIGEIGNSQSASVVVPALNDRDARVRLEAVRALGKMKNTAEYAEALRQRMDANVESDASVRDETWRVLQSILPDLPKEQLANLADRFRDDPERQLIVFQSLAQQLLKLRLEDELATTRQNIAATFMKLNDPKSAAEYFGLALDYRKTQGVPIVIAGLTEDRMHALLQSKQYPEAIVFASQSIKDSPDTQQSMGAAIRQEADRLQSSDDLGDSLKLITESRKMQPALAEQYRDQLTEIENSVKHRMAERGPGAAVPENASNRFEIIRTANGQ